MEKTYTVIFSYGIEVTAQNDSEAEQKAKQEWDEIAPRTDEMNIEVK